MGKIKGKKVYNNNNSKNNYNNNHVKTTMGESAMKKNNRDKRYIYVLKRCKELFYELNRLLFMMNF